MEEDKTIIKSLFPDADNFSWTISAPYTKSGQKEIVRNAEEFKKVIKEERVEEETGLPRSDGKNQILSWLLYCFYLLG